MMVDWQNIAVALGFTFGVAYLAAWAAGRLGRAALRGMLGPETSFSAPSVQRPIRIVEAAVFLLLAAALFRPALQAAGVEAQFGIDPEALALWFFASGLRIALILVLAYILIRVVGLLVQRFEFETSQSIDLDALERAKRARTMGRLIQNATAGAVMFIAVLMVLRELRLDVMPVLTGAGILGLAVGFGAQTLVRDIIGGFFLILENQVRVGDVAAINGTGGLVEAINLRTIVLRDLEGTVHIFPNGATETLSNRSKDFSFFVLDIGVAYREDTDRVVEVLEEAAATLLEDPRFRSNILEPLEVLGVEGFGDSQVTIRCRIKTVPLKQWETGRELRRRVKKAFDTHGIEIPFPHRSIHVGDASKPWPVSVRREE
jgi:moderate conductance mechanosensitive channel